MTYTLLHNDAIAALRELPSDSVDAIIADPPYGTTACKWDSVIPFEPMWAQLKRIVKPRGAIVLFGSQPFTSALVMSNVKWFRYEWVWDKKRVTGWLDCKKKPLKAHESVLVFYEEQCTYNPQMKRVGWHTRGPRAMRHRPNETYGAFVDGPQRSYESDEAYPRSLLPIGAVPIPTHPNEKPVALLEYLVRTYTNAGDTVLDFCFGSNTTGVACVNTERDYIGIERDADYFKIGERRIAEAEAARVLPLFAEAV